MKIRQIVFCVLAIFYSAFAFAQSNIICEKNYTPKLIKPMENWEIISGNRATIQTMNNFTGKKLLYSLVAKPNNPKNTIKINPRSGDIRIRARAKDNFDITIVAKNVCGSATMTFNVIIDEEV